MQRIAVIIAIVTATVILPVAAQAQTKDDFEYWDLNGNSDLTCSEASGKDEGLKLPAYRDDRDGTGLIYEWLQRQRSSDTDNDGIACNSTFKSKRLRAQSRFDHTSTHERARVSSRVTDVDGLASLRGRCPCKL